MVLVAKILHYLIVGKLKLFSRIRLFYFNVLPFIHVGTKTLIESNVTISTIYGGRITIDNYCELRKGCQLLSYGGNIIIGNNSSINPLYNDIWSR